jgi:hypothetical protein
MRFNAWLRQTRKNPIRNKFKIAAHAQKPPEGGFSNDQANRLSPVGFFCKRVPSQARIF